jgi:hypothetical protein
MRGAAAFVLVVAALTACGGDDAASSTSTSLPSLSTTTAAPTTAAGPTATTVQATTTTTTTAAPTTTTVSGPESYEFAVTGESVDGPQKIDATLGEEIVILVSADVTDEVHLHGYDVFADVAPDAPARLEVVTDIPGIFEIELEGARLVLTELEVR